MDTNRKLGEVAANLDDISDTLEEIKDAVHEGGTPSEEPSMDCSKTWRTPPARLTMWLTRDRGLNKNPAGSVERRVGTDALPLPRRLDL